MLTYSGFSPAEFANDLFDRANAYHNKPTTETDVENLCRAITDYIEKNSKMGESFSNAILATFENIPKSEARKFSKWIAHNSKAYPGKKLEIKGLYEPIHKLLSLAIQEVPNAASFLLKQIDSNCTTHATKIPFPKDIFGLILEKYIETSSLKELKALRATSKECESFSKKHLADCFKSSFFFKYNLFEAEKIAENNPSLKHFDISNTCFYHGRDQLKNICVSLPHLNNLIARNCKFDYECLTIISKHLRNLVELDLSFQNSDLSFQNSEPWCRIDCLSELKKIRHLNLSNNQISDPKVLSFLSNLETLDLSHNRMTQIPLEFKELTSLEDLDINSQLIRWGKLNCTHLKELKALKRLCLANNTIDPTDLNALQSLHKLKHLDLSRCRLEPIENQKFQLPSNLEFLDFHFTEIGPEILTQIHSLKNLEELRIDECKLSKLNLKSFKLPVSLKSLVFYSNHTGLECISNLFALKNLTHLEFSLNRINNECVEMIKWFKSLKKLTISYGSCEDEAVEKLKNLPHLKLDLRYCP